MASAMFAAPVKALREAIARGSLDDLNPLPWAFMTGNCLGWVAYSYITKDIFVLLANAPGLILSVWLNFGAVKLQYIEQFNSGKRGEVEEDDVSVELVKSRNNSSTNSDVNPEDGGRLTLDVPVDTEELDRNISAGVDVTSFSPHEKVVLAVVVGWVIVLSVVGLAPMSKREREDVVGIVVNLVLVFFYGGPLSTIFTVVRTQNSASIHYPTMAMTISNTAFWLAYGFARMDPFIILPNGAGFVLGLIMLALCIVFPRKPHPHQDGMEPVSNGEDQLIDNLVDDEVVPTHGDPTSQQSVRHRTGADSSIV